MPELKIYTDDEQYRYLKSLDNRSEYIRRLMEADEQYQEAEANV